MLTRICSGWYNQWLNATMGKLPLVKTLMVHFYCVGPALRAQVIFTKLQSTNPLFFICGKLF